MTIQEFDKQPFGANMTCNYMGAIFEIWSVSFDERLIMIAPPNTDIDKDYDIGRWVRCENVDLIP